MRIALLCLFVSVLLAPISRAQGVPIVELDHNLSTVQFYVKASVVLAGKFDKWEGKLTFASTDATTAVLDLKIAADSVDTGSGMKNGKLKGEKFFDPKTIRRSLSTPQKSSKLLLIPSKWTATSLSAASQIPKNSP
jgi:polyisoprenoid-binding protein YceI